MSDINCSECGHSREVHNDADVWYNEGDEDETWTNDGCMVCGRDGFGWPKCMHFEETV